MNTVPYNEMRCEVIDILFNGEYKELIDNISDIDCLTEKQKKTISSIVQNKNLFKIKSIEELENYSEIKKVQCDEWIKSDDLNLKKLAILEKLFNQDYETIKKQCVDIEELNDENLKKYLQCVNMIMKCDDSQLLEDIYNECNEENSLDKMSINLLIRRQYGNEFNNGLFNIKDANEIEENVFEAGTDLKMIVHVELKHHANYEKAWNQEKKNGIDYFCASYIRSDMLGTFGGGDSVTYGYCNLKPESLGAASANDIGSHKEGTIVRTPNGVINNTQNQKEALHNELNYQYFCDGKRQQPDYIVVFRHDGVINNMAEAKKAQKDWNGRLPIIIVDVNKCLESEKQKIEDMKQEYAKTKSPILARQIYQKICNNQKTIQYFKIQDRFYEDEQEQYKVTDNEIEKYSKEHQSELQVQAQQIQENEQKQDISEDVIQPSKITAIYNTIQNVINKDKTKIQVSAKDIAILDKESELTTTEVKQNVVLKLLNKIKEKINKGKSSYERL